MNRKAATALMDLAPDPVLETESVFVVGLTPDGRIALIVDDRSGQTTVRLPGLGGTRPLDTPAALHRRLKEECGVDAEELVVMSRYGIPTGQRGRATIVLAPQAQLHPDIRRGVELVPLTDLMIWLSDRRAEGWHIDPRVLVGLLLAERHYPRWARTRLAAIVERLGLRRAGGESRASPELWEQEKVRP